MIIAILYFCSLAPLDVIDTHSYVRCSLPATAIAMNDSKAREESLERIVRIPSLQLSSRFVPCNLPDYGRIRPSREPNGRFSSSSLLRFRWSFIFSLTPVRVASFKNALSVAHHVSCLRSRLVDQKYFAPLDSKVTWHRSRDVVPFSYNDSHKRLGFKYFYFPLSSKRLQEKINMNEFRVQLRSRVLLFRSYWAKVVL